MKTKQLISAATFSALLIVSNSAFAGETKTQKQRDNDKAAATLSTMVIGGLVGGPVGAFIGAVTGSLAAEQDRKSVV